MDFFEEYVTERLNEQRGDGAVRRRSPANGQDAQANPAGTGVGSTSTAPQISFPVPFHAHVYFQIPVEAYGLDLPPRVCRPLNVVRRFLALPPDPHDESGDRLQSLQHELRVAAAVVSGTPYVMPERWAQAGLTAAVWDEVAVIFTMEIHLRLLEERVMVESWLGWVRTVYQNEVDLRRAGIPVDPPR